jgi:plasmid stabilization system protein ParE
VTPPVFVRREARAEVAEAFRWYEARSVGLGHEFLRVVSVAFTSIQRAPEQHAIAVDDIRMVPLRRFPYVVYFVSTPRSTSVIAVIHSRRHPRRWQSRR